MKWLVVEFSLTKNGHNRDYGAISEFLGLLGNKKSYGDDSLTLFS